MTVFAMFAAICAHRERSGARYVTCIHKIVVFHAASLAEEAGAAVARASIAR